ncbi:MAG TPA: biotin carboxylase N-terminal domain-containing protein [Mycobacteriales bacterium]|nr:biotin carboxylase N-terminal domain-containing protein [Mycobacteriales bacterium]
MRRLLVANRGEIARRIFRTARSMGIETVAVFSDGDSDAPFAREADVALRLPGERASDTYLRGDLLVEAARVAAADAVHPGYGFLAENADFATAVVAAGLTWVGPPPEAIAAMGEKTEAKRLMEAAGVPTLPWTTDPAAGDGIGFPLLVKASAGGGGRGMRVVRSSESLAEAIESARREAETAFGDGTVFLERYLEASRHIEVQVLADRSGNVVALFERECSIQRRHQKIVEEAPSPAVDAALRRELGAAAVTAAKAVGYVGAGTVEFVLAPDGSYFFLEMNTRLQVEHPVTEAITGLDLVRLQLLIADGEPLPAKALEPTIDGHAIEVRVCAEDPKKGYLPVTGVLREFDFPGDVRVDSGFERGDAVSPHYDSLLAKVVAHAPTRAEAAAVLCRALRRARIHGVTTNRDLLAGILAEPDFLAGAVDTGYLDRHDPADLAPTQGPSPANAIAAVLALQVVRRGRASVLRGIPSGWRNNPSGSLPVVLTEAGAEVAVDYRFDRTGGLEVTVDGQPVDVELHSAAYHVIDATVAGVRRRYHVVVPADEATIDVDSDVGSSEFAVVPRFGATVAAPTAGSLVAPMPGTVVRVLVEPGAKVARDQPLVVLDAMKMEHTVASPADGTVVEMRVTAGHQVDAGAILAVVDTGGEPAA